MSDSEAISDSLKRPRLSLAGTRDRAETWCGQHTRNDVGQRAQCTFNLAHCAGVLGDEFAVHFQESGRQVGHIFSVAHGLREPVHSHGVDAFVNGSRVVASRTGMRRGCSSDARCDEVHGLPNWPRLMRVSREERDSTAVVWSHNVFRNEKQDQFY